MVYHEFGGAHTERKLRVVREYIDAYLKVMKYQNFEMIYIDAFAGTGKRATEIGEAPLLGEKTTKKITPGSARIALEHRQGFDRYFFIDNRKSHVKALARIIHERF